MGGVEISWLRWFVYALVGVPAIIWLITSRNNVMRLLAVMCVIVFIQDLFVWRRYILSLGIGPSLILGYVAVMGLYFQKRRFASFGTSGLLWMFFIAAAFMSAIAGSLGTGLIFVNLNLLQVFYLEGLFFFLLGMMALDDDEEVRRYFFWFTLVVSFGVATLHLFQLATGWRPANVELAVAAGNLGQGRIDTPGSVFINPNWLGSFYAMTVPFTLVQVLRGGYTGWRRTALTIALVTMLISLLLTTARGGIIFTFLLSGLALMLSGFSIGRIFSAGFAIAILAVAVFLLAALLLPEFFDRITAQYQEEGLETNRFRTFAIFTQIALDNPLGLGLHPENLKPLKRIYGIKLASAHNMYIDMAVKMGLLGLAAFLALLGHILLRNLRALVLTRPDPERYRGFLYLFLYVSGFAAAGIVEPIYDAGTTLPHMLWLVAGVSYAATMRALAPVRRPAVGWQTAVDGRLEHG